MNKSQQKQQKKRPINLNMNFHSKPPRFSILVLGLACYITGVITSIGAFSPTRGIPWHRLSSCSRQGNRLILSTIKDSDTADAGQKRQQDRLLSLLEYIENRVAEGRLPCGLDATDNEQDLVASVIAEVEQDQVNNLSTLQSGKITAKDLFGDWQLLYTSSQTMIINKSLSGLGRSASESAQFTSLVQKLGGSRFLGTVEFVEQFGKGEDVLEAFITGEWYTKPERNPFTGAPITVIDIDPKKVVCGPSTQNGDQWGSLGPIKRLDIVYLSHDLMISRVNVNPEYVFVWQRL